MTINELIAKGTNAYLAWVSQKREINNRDMIEQLMKQAINSRDVEEVNEIEKQANAYLANLYVNGEKTIYFAVDDTDYIHASVELRPIKNKRWIDFNDDFLKKELNALNMLNGCLNRLCISDSRNERPTLLTAAWHYICTIIDISRERALEAQYGPKAEREAAMKAQLTKMFK